MFETDLKGRVSVVELGIRIASLVKIGGASGNTNGAT
jgi:hypothetical protein